MGAVDGVTLSNTRFFAQRLNWRGVLVEALPDQLPALVRNRPESVCVGTAVCSDFSTVHYWRHAHSPLVSGGWVLAGAGGCWRVLALKQLVFSVLLPAMPACPALPCPALPCPALPCLPGISEFMSPAFLDRWYPADASLGLSGRRNVREELEVPCLPLHFILDAAGLHSFDLWSLDVEGAELEVGGWVLVGARCWRWVGGWVGGCRWAKWVLCACC